MDQQHIETLRASLRRVADALTPDEAAALRRMLGRTGGATAGSDHAEVRGYAVAEYEDAYGYKGRIGTGGESLNQPIAGGGKLVGAIGSEIWNRSGVPQALHVIRMIRNGYF